MSRSCQEEGKRGRHEGKREGESILRRELKGGKTGEGSKGEKSLRGGDQREEGRK